ncbi:DUF6541 family protein [Leucobacter chromiiresistens]|uniref:Uncharacterized protein n=1 Tax=Leucobacter chromiiresistens TaxID=1079994 RepID=A0A147EQI8_9MICO|nr:DUF6541 family protein [Leucobacter chromiiresistens]KTR86495.1 hypothetical protein NS354_04600 [Leucobacter chromiiresistens]
MTAWLPLALPALVALGIVAVLGLPSAYALRLRGAAAAVVAVPAAFAVLALAPIFSGALGIPWTLLSPFVVALILALVLLVLRRWLGVPREAAARRLAPSQRFWVLVGAAAIGGIATATILMLSMKSADAISQTYDAIFHLNATRLILDSGNASPFAMDLASPGDPAFYPTLWHGFVALVAQLSGASIPLATNAVLFVVCCVVWPIGAVALGRALAGPSTRVTVVSGVVAAAFPNFPLSLAGFGVLYPNLLSLALLPYVLVAALQLLGLGWSRRSLPLPIGTSWTLFIGSLGAAVLAHPNAVHVLILWLAVPIIAAAARAFRGGRIAAADGSLVQPSRSRALRASLAAVGLAAFAALVVLAWYFGRTTTNPWEGGHPSPFGAILDAVGATPKMEGHNWPVTLLVLLGAALLLRRRRLRWVLGLSLVLIAFYVIADGFPTSDWRTFFLSPWYNDPWRLAALVPLGALPLAVHGASAAAAVAGTAMRRTARMFPAGGERSRHAFWVAFATLFLLAATQGAGAFAAVNYVSSKYEFDRWSPLLSPDERAIIERLPQHVPDDAIIIDNPWNGGALAYALTGLEVLVPHTSGTYDPDVAELTSGIDRGTPEACAAAADLGAEFVLDFGREYVFPGTPRAIPYLGISGVEDSATLTEVDREGGAVLYRITGCDLN